MKTIALACLFLASSLYAQTVDYQKAAIAEFPDLAVEGSEFNKAFVVRLTTARSTNDPALRQPDWPLVLARQVARNLPATSSKRLDPASTALEIHKGVHGSEVSNALVQDSGGLTKFQKLFVADVATHSFSLKGVMVELSAFRKPDIAQTSDSTYSVKFYDDGKFLTATIPVELVSYVSSSKKLYVSVSEPDETFPKITIHGNTATFDGLSKVPRITWK